MALDPRLACRACFDGIAAGTSARIAGSLSPAPYLMPRHFGGDIDRPAEWLPTCEAHAREWWLDVPLVDRLPKVDLARATATGAANKRKVP